MKYKLIILIPTHNRPKLFERCLKSVLNNIPKDVKIIVNNDSNDIKEIKHEQVEYHYYQNKELYKIYNFLFLQASNYDFEYMYVLEDDDYVVKNFYKILMPEINKNLKCDLFFKYFPSVGIKYLREYNQDFENGFYKKDDFYFKFKEKDFQFSQVVFYGCDFFYFNKDRLDSDLLYFKNSKNNVFYIDKILYIQTTDGKDNISFEKYCRDPRFK